MPGIVLGIGGIDVNKAGVMSALLLTSGVNDKEERIL